MGNPILQFGTSRFLQAHADLFVSAALDAGRALGHVSVVQTTANPESLARIEALRERFENPFLDHRLADIARNHEQKKERRFKPVIELARELGVRVEQPRLNAALAARAHGG
ncbi:hypothetical protein F6X42_08590 [Paraburkholderia sp. WC7.3b]|uniref:D-mannonate oxidoreductase n=1 Tax=Paraburkholderia podalyriae TaxID=1938811 RepID=A0ABR7PK40_9BURK|nr:hypothetical protein [Paraburkholderia podalyriae]MBC8746665.1 hypothetical protein [Paraburkholderia podalyriae]